MLNLCIYPARLSLILYLPWLRASTWKISFQMLYNDQLTLSILLIIQIWFTTPSTYATPHYLCTKEGVDDAPHGGYCDVAPPPPTLLAVEHLPCFRGSIRFEAVHLLPESKSFLSFFYRCGTRKNVLVSVARFPIWLVPYWTRLWIIQLVNAKIGHSHSTKKPQVTTFLQVCRMCCTPV